MTTFAMAREFTAPAPQTAFRPDDDVLKLLAEIGLSAAVRGHGEQAAAIFAAFNLYKPDNPIATIGKALSEISAGRPEDAVARLRLAGVAHDTCPDELKAVLLIAFCLAGHQADASLLCRRLLNGGDGPSRQIALRLKRVIDAGLPGTDAAV